jgi:hypothetical protein
MNATLLTINDLEAVAAKDAAAQNAILSAISGRVYQIAGQELILGLSKDGSADVLKVAMQFNGQNMVLGLSQSLVNALLQDEGASLSDLNVEILNLLVRLKLIPKLPQGVQFKGLALGDNNSLEPAFQALTKQVTLRAVTPATGELLNWDVALYAMPQTSLGAFLKGFEFLVTKNIPSPLLKAKIAMPMIAAKTAIPAQQLRDIAVGDVILFG